MNTGARLGLAVTAGYVLGRLHKMKWALAVAALAGRGRLPSGPGGLLQQGAKAITSSPEFARLTEEMKGSLVEAGKAAAVAAVSGKINSFSDGLRERSDAMRTAGADSAEVGDEEDGEDDERHRAEGRAARAGRKRRRADDEDDGGRVPPPRRPGSRGESAGARATRRSGSRDDEVAKSQASHPSRHSGDGNGARSGSGARHGQDGGRSRPRSSASRSGGDNR